VAVDRPQEEPRRFYRYWNIEYNQRKAKADQTMDAIGACPGTWTEMFRDASEMSRVDYAVPSSPPRLPMSAGPIAAVVRSYELAVDHQHLLTWIGWRRLPAS
jgi:hypothetical protein